MQHTRGYTSHSQLIELEDNLETKNTHNLEEVTAIKGVHNWDNPSTFPRVTTMGTPTPLADLANVKDDDLDYGSLGEGLVMQHARGYTSHSPEDNSELATLQAQADLSDYIVFPHTYSFPRTVRILVIVRKFISAFREKWDPRYMATF